MRQVEADELACRCLNQHGEHNFSNQPLLTEAPFDTDLITPWQPSKPAQSRWLDPICVASVWYVVQQIHASAGRLSVQQAAGLDYLSERQFGRRCTALIGLAPKQLAELSCWQAVCRRLKSLPVAPLEAVALETGYHNAAHLTRAFRRYAGQTPASYRGN